MRFGWIRGLIGLSLCSVALAQPATQPAAPQPMSYDFNAPVIRLWPTDPPATQPFDGGDKVTGRGKPGQRPNLWVSRVEYPSLAVFLPEANGPTPAVVICPGGGYAGQAYSHEGTDVAKAFNARGVTAFVLKYRLPNGTPPAADKLPVPQQDVLRAIQLVRTRAAEFKIDPKKLGVVGFSAGGHLAATAATLFDQAKLIDTKDDIAQASARPDFAILVYPVISMSLPVTHAGSRQNLLGKDAPPELEARFDPSQHVTDNTPPLWVLQAVDDKAVPQANALSLIAAADKAKVSHALMLISHGGHGFGLGNNPESQAWFDTCVGWLRGQKILN